MGTAWQLLAALVAIAPLSGAAAILGDSHVATADAPHLVDAVATGLLESAIPFLLSNVAIRELQISTGVLILNLGLVMGVGLAVLLLGDHLISAGDEATGQGRARRRTPPRPVVSSPARGGVRCDPSRARGRERRT